MLARGPSGVPGGLVSRTGVRAGVPQEAPEPRVACLRSWGPSLPLCRPWTLFLRKAASRVWAAHDMQAGSEWIRVDPGAVVGPRAADGVGRVG